MLLLTPYHFTGAIIVNVDRTKKWLLITWTERRKTFQIVVQSFCNVFKINDCIDIECGLCLFGLDMFVNILLKSGTENIDVAPS